MYSFMRGNDYVKNAASSTGNGKSASVSNLQICGCTSRSSGKRYFWDKVQAGDVTRFMLTLTSLDFIPEVAFTASSSVCS